MWLLGENRPTILIRCAGISNRIRWAHLKQRRHVYISYKFGMGFYPVLLQIMQLNCVQQASISTRVNSSTFTRGQHVCVSLLLVSGRQCYAGRAIRWAACHAFLVLHRLYKKQEAFEKCWAHSPQCQFTRCRHCTVARRLRIDVHNDDDDNDNE